MWKSQNSRAIAMVVFSAKYTHPNILDIGLQMQRSFRSVQVSLVLLVEGCILKTTLWSALKKESTYLLPNH